MVPLDEARQLGKGFWLGESLSLFVQFLHRSSIIIPHIAWPIVVGLG